jgi:hypothetical protein
MSPRVIEVSRVRSAVPVAGFLLATGLAWLIGGPLAWVSPP